MQAETLPRSFLTKKYMKTLPLDKITEEINWDEYGLSGIGEKRAQIIKKDFELV